MSFNPILPSSSSGANNTQINKLAADVRGSKVTQVFKDAKDRRVLLGRGKDDFYGLKVSKPGFDVYSASDDNLIFNSNNNVFKILEKRTVTLVKSASTDGVEVIETHTYDFNPIVFAFWTSATVNAPLPYFNVNATSGIIDEQIWCYTRLSGRQIRFFIKTPSAGSLYASSLERTITYYLLQETSD
jgi:hypothetical protein